MEIYKYSVPIRNFPYVIECTFAYDDFFLVGTKEGHIIRYQLETKSKSNNDGDFKVSMIRFEKNLFRKPIVQIHVIPEQRILLCLSENLVTVHNVDKIEFPIITTLAKTKGASCFAVDVARIRTLTGEIQHTIRLVVYAKNQLLFYYWKNNDFHELRPNIKLTDTPKDLIYLGSFVYASFKNLKNQYIKIDCDKGTQKEVAAFNMHNTSSTTTAPILTTLTGNESGTVNFVSTEPLRSDSFSSTGLACFREKKTYILNKDAIPILEFPVTWADEPIAFADDLLYLLAILAKDSSIEVVSTSAKRIVAVQRIMFDFSNSNSISKPLKCISKWANRIGQLILHSEKDIVILKARSKEQQIQILKREKYFDLALKLIEVDSVQESPVKDSLSSSELSVSPPQRESPQLGHDSDSEHPSAKEIIKNDILRKQALDQFCSGQFRQAISIFQSLKTDPSYVIGLFPDLLPDQYRATLKYPDKLPIFEGAALDQGLLSLTDYLLEIRNKIRDDLSLFEKHPNNHNQPSSAFYFGMTYNELLKLQSIIETSLLKCYIQTNISLADSLLRLQNNHCHFEETEKALKKKQKYKQLVIFYRTKGLHKNALELLEKQARYNDEQNKKINRGYLIRYMKKLGPSHLSLIFQFCEWLVREYPDEGLSVFIDTVEETSQFPCESVLAFLESANSGLVIPYLEHCIYKWKEERSKFHDALINKYRERIRYLMSEYQLEMHQQFIENRMEILDENETIDPEDSSSLTQSGDSIPGLVKDYFLRPEPAGQEPNELGEYRRKLIRLLEESNSYSTETLPTYLLHDGLFDERAIVMGKIGNHQEALMIYVHVLQDLQRAEEYCLKQYCKPNASQACRDVFLILLEQCLKSPNCEQLRIRKCHFGYDSKKQQSAGIVPQFGEQFKTNQEGLLASLPPKVLLAISILARHSNRIDLQRALGLLPPDLPLSALIFILIQSLEHLNSRRNYLKVLRQLLHAERLRAHQSRIRIEQSRRLELKPTDICQACAKKIGKSVFVCYSNRDLVHFGCRELYEQTFPSNS